MNEKTESNDWNERKVGQWPYRYRYTDEGLVLEGGAVFVGSMPNLVQEREEDGRWGLEQEGNTYTTFFEMEIRTTDSGLVQLYLMGHALAPVMFGQGDEGDIILVKQSASRGSSWYPRVQGKDIEKFVEQLIVQGVFVPFFSLEVVC